MFIIRIKDAEFWALSDVSLEVKADETPIRFVVYGNRVMNINSAFLLRVWCENIIIILSPAKKSTNFLPGDFFVLSLRRNQCNQGYEYIYKCWKYSV